LNFGCFISYRSEVVNDLLAVDRQFGFSEQCLLPIT